MGYEEEFMRFLQSLLTDVERRIRKGQARLSLNNTQGGVGHVCYYYQSNLEIFSFRVDSVVFANSLFVSSNH